MYSPSAKEIALEARDALQRSYASVTSQQRWQRWIERGWINRKGELTWVLGGDATPEVPLNEDGTPVNPPSDAAPSDANGQGN